MLLELAGVQAFYGARPALHEVSFAVAEGSITALLGANGAGKTTVLRAICGMVRSAGHIVFDGVDLARRATEDIVRLGLAHVPEGRGTFHRLSVLENLQLGATTRHDTRGIAADLERIHAWFPRLAERSAQQAGTLSGGEQQMLALARALMQRPRLMLLDEPSFGLAPLIVAELFEVLARIRAETGVAMLIVEQNAAQALALADQACLLETGRIVRSGSAAELRADDGVQRAYLGH